jgi:hypothetical protein
MGCRIFVIGAKKKFAEGAIGGVLPKKAARTVDCPCREASDATYAGQNGEFPGSGRKLWSQLRSGLQE